MNNKQAPMAQRSRKKLVFEHKDMDFYLSWIIGRHIFEGSMPEECMVTAAKITDGAPESWQSEWVELARRVESEAEAALNKGEQEQARKAYLRACSYYRAPLFIMDPKDPAFPRNWNRQHSCFQKAAALFDLPIKPIKVPYMGRFLPGYFWKVDDSGKKRPTLVVIGGMETFAEDCYFITGPTGTRRGYNILTADLPGQGMNPENNLFLEANMEIPVQSVVDYALSLPEVDPEHLALFGFSWGGHIVLKGAQHDRRIKALVANPPMPNVFRAAAAQQSGQGSGDRSTKMVFEQLAWRFGVKMSDILKRLGKAYEYLVYGKADCRKVLCPALFMAGEGEAPITLQLARESFIQLPNSHKKLAILTEKEGGEAHCQVDNLELLNRVIFDWLDAVFSSSPGLRHPSFTRKTYRQDIR